MFWNACSKLRKALSSSAPKNLTACCANIFDLWLMWTSAEKSTILHSTETGLILQIFLDVCNKHATLSACRNSTACIPPTSLTFDCSGPWPKHTPNYTVQSLISFCKYFQMLAASEGSFWPLQHPEISQPALHQRPWPGQEHQAAVRICALSPPSGPCWLPRHDATGGVMGEHHDQGRVVSLWCVYS